MPTIPPHSLDSEHAVLGALLLDNDAIDRLDGLKSEHFYVHDNKLIFESIQQLIGHQQPADVLTVYDCMTTRKERVELAYLHSMAANTPSSANVGHYSKIVQERALERGILNAAGKATEIVSGVLPAAEKLDAVQAEFGKLSEETVRKEPVSIQSALHAYIEDLDQRYHGKTPNPGIATGLADLDKILNGGMRRGALITLGARPGMGKSAFGETVALNAALKGYATLFLSMEMPETEVTERSIAIAGQMPAAALSAAGPDMDRDGHWTRVTAAVQRLQDAKFYIDDEPGLSLLQVVSKARAVKRKHGLDLLVVDYLQLMSGTERERYQQIEAITKGLKILAKNLNIVVLALSQFSRDIEKRLQPRPKPSDFRDGGSIEQDSDILLGLHRAAQDNPDAEDTGYSELFVMKNRQGKTGKLPLMYIGEQMRFANFTGPIPVDEPVRKKSRGFDG